MSDQLQSPDFKVQSLNSAPVRKGDGNVTLNFAYVNLAESLYPAMMRLCPPGALCPDVASSTVISGYGNLISENLKVNGLNLRADYFSGIPGGTACLTAAKNALANHSHLTISGKATIVPQSTGVASGTTTSSTGTIVISSQGSVSSGPSQTIGIAMNLAQQLNSGAIANPPDFREPSVEAVFTEITSCVESREIYPSPQPGPRPLILNNESLAR